MQSLLAQGVLICYGLPCSCIVCHGKNAYSLDMIPLLAMATVLAIFNSCNFSVQLHLAISCSECICFEMQAASRHEAAASAYNKHLGQLDGKHGTLDADSEAFLVERCCEAYAAVADWQGLQQWLQDVKVS